MKLFKTSGDYKLHCQRLFGSKFFTRSMSFMTNVESKKTQSGEAKLLQSNSRCRAGVYSLHRRQLGRVGRRTT